MRNASYILDLLELAKIPYSIASGFDCRTAKWQSACIHSAEVHSQSFFVGLQGENSNGGKFAQDTIDRGATLLLIEQGYDRTLRPAKQECTVIVVENALVALASISKEIRHEFRNSCVFIGITGSAGKTTTKSILHHLLNHHASAVCSKGNLNTLEGMSLCLLNTEFADVQYAVFECGISAVGEMQTLVAILDPDYALVTNVGYAHMGGYRDIAQLREEKLRIATHIQAEGVLWLPEDDKALFETAEALGLNCQVRTHGYDSLQGFIEWQDRQLQGTVLHCEDMQFSCPLIGEVNVQNLVSALVVLDYFGLARTTSKEAVAILSPEHGRYQLINKAPLIIDDAYNASPGAVEQSMAWFARLSYQPKIAVLAGMKELGAQSLELHQRLLQFCKNLAIDHLFLLGEEYEALPIEKSHICKVTTKQQLIAKIKLVLTKDGVLIFKGSRYYQLETIVSELLRV